MTLYYAMKYRNIGLLCDAMREVAIIFQSPLSEKPKYVWAMLRQMYIFDIAFADPVLQEAYLVNVFINPQNLSNTFYEMNLLLEY